jgi:hypothetical protein
MKLPLQKPCLIFLNVLHGGSESEKILDAFTFYCIPMLNPDGAALYTRENANKVDLNRDSQTLTVRSKLLRAVLKSLNLIIAFTISALLA